MVQVVHDNVGALDAALRVAAGVGALAAAASTFALLSEQWGLVTWIHGAILAAYLLLTSFARFDPAYEMLGVDTTVRARRRRVASRALPPTGRRAA